jgi:ABC-type Fe3+-hydroxamate transport system substrate-binding protein
LLGNREAVEALRPTLNYIVIDRGELVRADTEAIQLLSKRVPVVAFVYNHFAGFARETLRQLAALLGQEHSV